jgi:hypothetical protein
MGESGLQQELFKIIKSRLTTDASVAEQIAELLEISTDSAYRRIKRRKTGYV